MDPLLAQTDSRFTVFPIRYPELWSMYKKSVASFWTVEEIDLSGDLKDWETLNDNERHFIRMVLAFFASSDGIVFENLDLNFGSEIQIPEARAFYAYQGFNEMIHGETYALMIDKLVKDPVEKDTLFHAIENLECVRSKAQWALKYMNSTIPFAQRLVAFACVEGIFFSGSFCALFWLKKRGLMPGLCFSNELISRDEGMHQRFAVQVYKMLKEKPTSDTIRDIVREAVAIERVFITESLPCTLIGMSAQYMIQYIEYVADRLLTELGQEKLFHSENPFSWMENIALEGKTNFFEKRVGEYAKHMTDDTDTIRFNEDF